MNPAARVREEKELHPERFCTRRDCLWRVKTVRGENPCRRHPVAPPVSRLREQVGPTMPGPM